MLVSKSVLVSLAAISAPAIASNSISRVAVDPLGNPIQSGSIEASISRDGTRVTFKSASTSVVTGDNNESTDYFVRDYLSGQTKLVNVTASGVQANGLCFDARISADGRYVSFVSKASNLAPSDTDEEIDVFVKDLLTGALKHASLTSGGASANADCLHSRLNADGRYVVFGSAATNLVPNDTNGAADVFVRDLVTGQLECVSVDSSGVPVGALQGGEASISGDGRYVAYVATGTSSGAVLWDRQTALATPVSVDTAGILQPAIHPIVSEDGSTIVFWTYVPLRVGDPASTPDLYFVRAQSGGLSLPKQITDGSYLVGTTLSEATSISSDGRFVTFYTGHAYVPDDVNDKKDVYVADLTMNTIQPVSKGVFGFGNGDSTDGALSGDGRSCVLHSWATNLVVGDTSSSQETFRVDLSGEAKWKVFGTGVNGSAGALELALASEPELGKANALTVSVGSGSIPAFVLTGVIPFTTPTVYGGLLYLVPTATVATTATASGTVLPFVIRNEPDLAGFTFYAQALGLDAGAPQGISFSAAIEAVIGN